MFSEEILLGSSNFTFQGLKSSYFLGLGFSLFFYSLKLKVLLN